MIDDQVTKIKTIDEEINQIMLSDKRFAEEFDQELDKQAEYHLEISLALDNFEDLMIVKKEELPSTDKLIHVLSKLDTSEGKPPPLQCGTFSGSEKVKFAFSQFFSSI